MFNKSKTRLICFPLARTGGYTIPVGVAVIGEVAFSNCRKLTNISFPDSVTEIERGAFYYCVGLSNIKIGKGVKKLGPQAFHACSSLETVVVAENMGSIGQWAFDLSMGYYPHQMLFLGDAPSFENPFISPVMDIPDVKHSQREKRYWALGWTTTGLYVKI